MLVPVTTDPTSVESTSTPIQVGVKNRPDPRTVVLVVFTINALVMSPTSLAVVMCAVGVSLLALTVTRAFRWALTLLAVESFWLLLALIPGQLWHSTWTALVAVLGYWMFKLCAAGGIAAYAVAVVVPSELVAGLRQLRVPIGITVPLTVLFRFIPIVFVEYAAVREAMSLRGLRMGWQGIIHPLKYLEFILVPLLSACARLADEMTAAGMVRGLGSRIRPTTIKKLRFGWMDVAWIAVLALLLYLKPHLESITLVGGGIA